jgi:hypothetical protein
MIENWTAFAKSGLGGPYGFFIENNTRGRHKSVHPVISSGSEKSFQKIPRRWRSSE